MCEFIVKQLAANNGSQYSSPSLSSSEQPGAKEPERAHFLVKAAWRNTVSSSVWSLCKSHVDNDISEASELISPGACLALLSAGLL